MTMKKFITMDLDTGKKVLQTIEASFIKLTDQQHFHGAANLEEALKAEIARAVAEENVLTEKLEQEIQRAEHAEAAIEALIGELGKDKSVKAAIDRIDGLIAELTSRVSAHVDNQEVHITADERTRWEKTVTDLADKADKVTTEQELEKKVNKDELFDNKKIKTDLLPSIAVNTVHTVADVAEAMRLEIENGDVVIINPDAKTPKTNKVVTGTFICVDDKGDTFDKKFRQLYSNTDYISKAEVNNLIKAETDRATEAEDGLRRDILIINDDDDTTVGSIKHAVKIERERAEEVEDELDQRLTVIEPTVQKLAGGKDAEGSAAYLADTALTEAKEYTSEKIEEVKTAADELSGKVQALEEKVGDDTTGLVKDVTVLKSDVATIKGDERTDGSINKALADAKKYADEKVAEEQVTRADEDKKLSDRLDVLEASENLSIKLGCNGVVVHDLLAIRAGNNVVKAELSDSSVVGIVTRADGPNSNTVVSGRVSGFKGLKPGSSYFLGENGQITDKIPTEVGQYIIKVGVALTTTDLLVNVQEAIRIGD